MLPNFLLPIGMKPLQHRPDRISQNNTLRMLLKIIPESAIFLWQFRVVGEGRGKDNLFGCRAHQKYGFETPS